MSESGLIQELAETRQKLAIAEDGKAAALRLVSETAAELARVQAEAERLRDALNKHDARALFAWDEIRKRIRRSRWITEGRGMYQYDDDRYREETGIAFDEIQDQVEAAIKETEPIAALAENPAEKKEKT